MEGLRAWVLVSECATAEPDFSRVDTQQVTLTFLVRVVADT